MSLGESHDDRRNFDRIPIGVARQGVLIDLIRQHFGNNIGRVSPMAAVAHGLSVAGPEFEVPGTGEDGSAVAVGIWKSGSDLTTLWTTPQPNGISTIIQDAATSSGGDFLSVRIIVISRLESRW
jgi:hypothetical protein